MAHELSMGFERDGKHYIVSSVDEKGKRMTAKAAAKRWKVLGGPYKSQDEATAASKRRSAAYKPTKERKTKEQQSPKEVKDVKGKRMESY